MVNPVGLIANSWSEIIITYLSANYLEAIATILGFIYIYFSIREDKKLWIFGFLSSLIYVYVCFNSRIYADMGINIYYVVISIYGWVHWTLYREENKRIIPVTRLTTIQWFYILLPILILFLIIGVFLDKLTNSDIAYYDAFTTAASIVATWMLTRKILENWLIWIVVDAASVFLYVYKGLYSTSVLFLVYTVLAIIGFIEWKKSLYKSE